MKKMSTASERGDANMNRRTEDRKKRREYHPNGETVTEHPLNRRNFLTLVGGGMLVAPLILPSNGEKGQVQRKESRAPGSEAPIILPDFRFSLTQQPARELPGGSAREATAREFPVSKKTPMPLTPNRLR
jgi:hypothetical protein